MGCGSSTLRIGGACLQAHDADKDKRSKELEERRKIFEWEMLYPGLFPLMKDVPDTETGGRNTQETVDFWGGVAIALGNMGAQQLIHAFEAEDDDFDPFRAIFTTGANVGHGLPYVAVEPANRWETDAEFAWQKINGVVPWHVKKVDALPAACILTDAKLEGLLPSGTTIESLMKAGRLFISDYSKLDAEGLDIAPEVCSYGGYAILWANEEKQLMPLAVQISTKAELATIFTPNDKPNNWLAAKMHAQSQEKNYDSIYHIMACHVYMESVYDSMQRNLHFNHPIHVLLHEHFYHTLLVNGNVKSHYFNPSDPSAMCFQVGKKREEWLALHAPDWSFEYYNMPDNFAKRGVTDLKNNFCMDDTLVLWKLIADFVSGVLDTFYKSDDDVANDPELANWIKEMTAPVTNEATGCGFKGLPLTDGKMTTLAQVKLFCTMILNNVSVNHAATGNAEYQIQGFAPNMPSQFKLPLETLKGHQDAGTDVDRAAIKKALGGKIGQLLGVINVVHHADRKSNPMVVYNKDFFKANEIKDLVLTFQKGIAAAEETMRSRNKVVEDAQAAKPEGGNRPYEFLLPSDVGMSITT